MKILALDLGSDTGFAFYGFQHEETVFGTWNLATRKNLQYAAKLRMDRKLDIRALALWTRLQNYRDTDYIFFEDVRFARSQAQAHLWASFRGVVWAFASSIGCQTECLDTGKLKSFATGRGDAKKPQMAAAWVRKHPGRYVLEKELVKDTFSGTFLDDNAVDALHLLDWAKSLLVK